MNSHTVDAMNWLTAADSVRAGQDASHQLQAAQACAIIAVAEELRTANLLALATLQASQRDIDGARQLRDHVAERLA